MNDRSVVNCLQFVAGNGITIPPFLPTTTICSQEPVNDLDTWDLQKYDVIIFGWGSSCVSEHVISFMYNANETAKLNFLQNTILNKVGVNILNFSRDGG